MLLRFYFGTGCSLVTIEIKSLSFNQVKNRFAFSSSVYLAWLAEIKIYQRSNWHYTCTGITDNSQRGLVNHHNIIQIAHNLQFLSLGWIFPTVSLWRFLLSTEEVSSLLVNKSFSGRAGILCQFLLQVHMRSSFNRDSFQVTEIIPSKPGTLEWATSIQWP